MATKPRPNQAFDQPHYGHGRNPPPDCPDCAGTGRVTFDTRANYPGKVLYHDCETCQGSGTAETDPEEENIP